MGNYEVVGGDMMSAIVDCQGGRLRPGIFGYAGKGIVKTESLELDGVAA
jgi:hypothetical protein